MAEQKKTSFEGVQVWYTYCPVIHTGNVDGELGWTKEEYKKLGVKYSYFRSVRENDYYGQVISPNGGLVIEL